MTEKKLQASVTGARIRMGRPKDQAKRQAILAAAVQLFTSTPYDMVTMEAVAAQAGVSKMTVYSHFEDKETLFEMIVTSVSDRMVAAFGASDRDDASLRERLVCIGIGFMSIILGPDVIGLSQMLPMALRSSQVLTERFHNAGPGRVKPLLIDMIASAAESGQLEVDDPLLAAQDLFSLWEGGLKPDHGCGGGGVVTPEAIDRHVRRGTDVFLRAYTPRAG